MNGRSFISCTSSNDFPSQADVQIWLSLGGDLGFLGFSRTPSVKLQVANVFERESPISCWNRSGERGLAAQTPSSSRWTLSMWMEFLERIKIFENIVSQMDPECRYYINTHLRIEKRSLPWFFLSITPSLKYHSTVGWNRSAIGNSNFSGQRNAMLSPSYA